MSIFTSKKTKWRKSIQDHQDSRGEFNQLSATMGQKPAEAYLETIYDWAGDSKMKIDTLKPDMISDFIKMERENVVSKRQYVTSLVSETKSGNLGTILNANLRPEMDYYKNRAGTGLAARKLAIDKAANWICGSYVAALGSTRALLEEYIPTNPGQHGKAGAALGRTPDSIRKVHKKAVLNAPAYRFNYLGGAVKYPSTVGAKCLMEELFQLTAGTNVWPQFGDAHWESIAMFYLVSLVTIQAFSDGNKRAGHLAYAIVLIKGTHTFKAPTAAKESELFRMNG